MGRNSKKIVISGSDQSEIEKLLTQGTHKSRTITRAQILLKNAQGMSPLEIAAFFNTSVNRVRKTLRLYEQGNLSAALYERTRVGRPAKIDEQMEAKVTLLACSSAPEGHNAWTLRMIADKYVELTPEQPISHETVRKILKKANSNLGKKFNGVLASRLASI